MRKKTELHHIQVSLFRLRVSKGRYPTDIAYEDLCREEIADLMADAVNIYENTQLDLRRVKREGKTVWRFINRNGL